MNKQQERFENSVILDSDLTVYDNDDCGEKKLSIEEILSTPLSDILMDRRRQLSIEEKTGLQIIVWYKMSQLSEDEKLLAHKYFVEQKTAEEISQECEFEVTTNYNKDKNKFRHISQQAVCDRIKKLKQKLQLII